MKHLFFTLGIVFFAVTVYALNPFAAGTLTMDFSYSEREDAALTAVYGSGWKTEVRPVIRQAWANICSSAKDQYRTRRSDLLIDEGAEALMTAAERNQVGRVADSIAARKAMNERNQRIADSLARAQQIQP